MSKKVTRIIRCAWCEKEGVPADMRTDVVEVDDPDELDPMISHGICKRHQTEMLKQLGKEDKKK